MTIATYPDDAIAPITAFSVVATASDNEQVPKPNNIWNDSVWDKTI